jgi:hypothetical protein
VTWVSARAGGAAAGLILTVRTGSQTGKAKQMTPARMPNSVLRTREHPAPSEVERLMDAARLELVDLRWDQVEFGSGA